MDMPMSKRRAAVAGASGLVDLPEYIITTFFPAARPLLESYPSLFRVVGIVLALWYFGPVARLQSLWSQFSTLIVATVNVSSEEDLFGYLTAYVSERKTLRVDKTLNASSTLTQERRRRHDDSDYEELRQPGDDPKIQYEQGQGMQLFVHKGRLFYVTRKYGEGHTYHGNRYKRIETLSLSCLGRSTEPIKDLVEHVYRTNLDKERALTIIRRPYSGGYGGRLTWSRLTSKPRRALDTVILDANQKEQILADVAEYMDEATMSFYASHGIPYRRGYLFHGPPGVGKTSFALALASRFSLEVYSLTLLDRDLTDSDLISLLNQLPGRSLLLLEDIDSAGLSRKGKLSSARKKSFQRRLKMPEGAIASARADADADDLDSSDDESSSTSRVTLSGLLNAIDGVAAPEGHILIMTTNKPEELDDALVRAGRISVRVDFKNASKKQAEEIFLRMFCDFSGPTNAPLADDVDPSAAEMGQTSATPNPAHIGTLAKQFAATIPNHDFSPADLQDFLLMHKKNAAAAVEQLPQWMERQYEERRKVEEARELDREIKREAKREERRTFREELKAAVMEAEGTRGDVRTTGVAVQSGEHLTLNGKESDVDDESDDVETKHPSR